VKHTGVLSLSLEGESRDHVVVTGDVDAVQLANKLRKEFRYTTLISVKDMEEDGEEDEEEEEKEEEEEATPKLHYDNYHPPPCPICTTYLPHCPLPTCSFPPPPMYYESDSNSCTIL